MTAIASRQKRFCKKPRLCVHCSTAGDLVSVSPYIYVRGKRLTAGERVVICQADLLQCVIGPEDSKVVRKVSQSLMESLRVAYKALQTSCDDESQQHAALVFETQEEIR